MITSMGKKKDEKAVHSYSVRTQVPENMVWLDIEAGTSGAFRMQ